MTKPNLVLLGRFGAPHGVRGEIRLQSHTADPLAIGSYGLLTDKSGGKTFKLQSVRPQGKDMLVARVEGVADRSTAERLTGVELYIAREKLPAPEDEDEFYLADLVGLRAETRDGELIGHVVGLINFGAGDILEIQPPQGETILLPFTKAVVPIVDVAGGRVVVEPPAEIEGPAD
ncbi:ribosome maturation factor RimM [Methylocystis sp. MJC1]|jgi:16S rRNA processing protein RimM|uniref:ribosome maturation factor RimM n=1 Tax=Methylocystis sp. MJC1 TaxID=2654282 RepID=UPI0013E9F7DA|nr:ribosome maturation factor RimM [Methylocystis sp. MJC1]KAF2991986.1 Ribosome maturation factor RimM [Methylocystis sp. MJC1]MBU6525475.1 ribosome maturation factor RimM [Methylocystis sp. MJC1]UZX11964.1 ribosome maturation factor RimM [Methylocystis sp. MJC1]